MTYVIDNTYKYDDVTQRFVNNLFKSMNESISASEQPKVTTPTSNSSATAKSSNPLQDIINIAFGSSPETAKSLNPALDVIMDVFNTITQPEKPTKADSVKNKPSSNTSKDDVPITQPTAQSSHCAFSGPKTKEMYAKIEKLAKELITLPGGEKYLKEVEEYRDAVMCQLLTNDYQKMLEFRENVNSQYVTTSLEQIVKKLKPNVLLPEAAKASLVTYANGYLISKKKIKSINESFEVMPRDAIAYDTCVEKWLNANTGMYVVV
jgi:hypothetical protein